FPIKAGETLDDTAQHLLATLSINPQVNFSLAQRQQLWTHLWGLHLKRELWRVGGINSALLEPSEFQTGVLNTLRSTVMDIPEAQLYLSDCSGITDLSSLAGLDTIHNLALWNCTGIGDLSFMKNLSSLERLGLIGCTAVSDISPLAGLSRLVALTLTGCTQIRDFSYLARLFGLEELGLAYDTNIRDLAPLTGLTALRELSLNGCTAIRDLAPLTGLSNLRELDLQGCTGLKKEQVEALRVELPVCVIHF
ncbi:MAG: hypothetical protein KKH61_19775, partial [Gammaproteobacteria bacterium]|nr:hypothetical protein [Gammaproteobacteria bacterium]